MSGVKHSLFILYVADQARSSEFYTKLLQLQPTLNVPGMTEFTLSDSCKLGLMPTNGIAQIIGHSMPHPDLGNGIPRCELYLTVDQVSVAFEHASNLGVTIVSPPQDMDWGHRVCYLADNDGHVIAFASIIK